MGYLFCYCLHKIKIWLMQFLANATFSRSQQSHKARTLCIPICVNKQIQEVFEKIIMIIYSEGFPRSVMIFGTLSPTLTFACDNFIKTRNNNIVNQDSLERSDY